MGSAGVNHLRLADRQGVIIGSDLVFDRPAVRPGNHLHHFIIPVIEFCKQDAIRRVVLALVEKILQPHCLPVKGVEVFFFRRLPDPVCHFTDTIFLGGLTASRRRRTRADKTDREQ